MTNIVCSLCSIRYMFYSSAALLALPLAYFFLMESHPFQALFSGIWSSRTIDIIRGTSAIVLVTIGELS